MLHEYHVIYSFRYYSRFHVTAVGLGTYYPWIRRSACLYIYIYIYKGKAVPLQAWSGPEGSMKVKVPRVHDRIIDEIKYTQIFD